MTAVDFERIRQWLMGWPGWQEAEKLHIEYTDSAPGNCGLFSGGLEEVSRKADLLGNVTVRCRYRFELCRVVAREADGNAAVRWVQELQNWVQEQSVRGLAPVFGDVPGDEWIRGEKGHLLKNRQPGNAMYSVALSGEFTKKYEVNE